ncbi:HIG1 domain-containing protein [Vibrio alginolyticus]|nr:HIG1 domain-containing protein [Vibrio alginolyticus]
MTLLLKLSLFLMRWRVAFQPTVVLFLIVVLIAR